MTEYFSRKKACTTISAWRRKPAEVSHRRYRAGKKYFLCIKAGACLPLGAEPAHPPPMRFSELARAELPAELAGQVQRLLELKMNSPK